MGGYCGTCGEPNWLENAKTSSAIGAKKSPPVNAAAL